MKRRIALITVGLALAVALPAMAQVKRKGPPVDTRPVDRPADGYDKPGKGRPPVTVTSWSPHSGPVGTAVTITGTGFNPRTLVLVGGSRVRPARITPTSIELVIPRAYGDGLIVLRRRGLAHDLEVGRFEVFADAYIRSFSPTYGVAGTRVEILGSGFRRGDQVSMNGRSIAISELSPNRLVVVIPNDATTDFLTITRINGASVRSRQRFRVDLPAPVITSLSPESGPIGTRVRVHGQYFTPGDRVFFGRHPVRTTGGAASWVEFVVPPGPGRSEYVRIKNRYGEAVSPQPFDLSRPPVVGRFSPGYGSPGTRVELFGDYFQPGDHVAIEGVACKILELRDRQISIEIPPSARTGPFVVRRGGSEYPSRQVFRVLRAPEVTGFSPESGEPGTQVTITGDHFPPGAQVFYGKQRLRVLKGTDVALIVEIPRGAIDEPFIIRTAGGDATTRRRFHVVYYSEITGPPRPAAGPPGTRIALVGRGFGASDRFWIGDALLTVETWSPNRVMAVVPDGARTGPISWESNGRRTDSRWNFVVYLAPTITSIAPHSGPPGTQVEIRGDNFSPRVRAWWGTTPLRIYRRELPTRLWVAIPRGASGSNYIEIEDSGTRARSGRPFDVIGPIQVTGFSPAAGTVGTEVTINGANFTAKTTARYGATDLPIVRWRPDTLVVRIPEGPGPSRDYFHLQDGPGHARSPARFELTAYATIRGLRPPRVRAGQDIVIHGDNLGTHVRVLFGNTECEVVTAARDGRQLRVRLPKSAAGAAYIWVEDHGNRSRSPDRLTIEGELKLPAEEAPPGPPPRKRPPRKPPQKY